MEQAHTLQSEKKAAQTHTMANGEEIEVIKVLYCCSYGGFGISKEANKYLTQLGFVRKLEEGGFVEEWKRTDQKLIEVLEKFGLEEASGFACELAITYVPAEMAQFVQISEYDGSERVNIAYDKAFSSLLQKIMEKNSTHEFDLISGLSSEIYVNIKPEKELYNRYLYLQKNFRVY